MRFLLTIFLSLLAAYALSLWLTVSVNPEVEFWREVMIRRDREIAQVRNEQPGKPVILFTGGSSTAFSIDPKIIEETCELPAFNLGLPIASGAPYILHQAMKRCKPGDVMVICLEADILAYMGETKPSTLSFALGLLDSDIDGAGGGDTLGSRISLRESLNLPRPGPTYLTTLGARMATGKGYRYTPEDIRYHGRIETPQQNPNIVPLGEPLERRLHPDAEAILSKLSATATGKNVRLFYSMPWRYTSAGTEEAWRLENKALLNDIHRIIPVLDDPSRGASSDRDDFSDSVQHLTARGSARRTKLLALALKAALASER